MNFGSFNSEARNRDSKARDCDTRSRDHDPKARNRDSEVRNRDTGTQDCDPPLESTPTGQAEMACCPKGRSSSFLDGLLADLRIEFASTRRRYFSTVKGTEYCVSSQISLITPPPSAPFSTAIVNSVSYTHLTLPTKR